MTSMLALLSCDQISFGMRTFFNVMKEVCLGIDYLVLLISGILVAHTIRVMWHWCGATHFGLVYIWLCGEIFFLSLKSEKTIKEVTDFIKHLNTTTVLSMIIYTKGIDTWTAERDYQIPSSAASNVKILRLGPKSQAVPSGNYRSYNRRDYIGSFKH